MPDAILRKARGGSADRAEIEAAMLAAGFAHFLRAIALGKHHHRAAGRLELLHERIHAPRCRRAERTRGKAFGRLCRACVIDGMVLEIIGQALPGFEPFAQLCMGQIARHNNRAGERQARLDRML